MNSYIKGNIKAVFFKSDSGFMVGNFKVKLMKKIMRFI